MIPAWVAILGALGGPTLVTLVFAFVNKLIDRRDAQRKEAAALEAKAAEDAEEKAATRDGRELDTFNTTRASVEAHIRWDYMIMARLQNVEASNNEMRVKLGLEPIVFPVIEPPPSFFSRPTP